MPFITKEEILKIAHMSRIRIENNEVDEILGHLQAVLAYARRVNEVVTPELLPVYQNINVFRDDVAIPFDAISIKNEGPEVEADYFVVPAILEQ